MTHMMIGLTLITWGIAGIFDKKAVQSSSAKSVFVVFHAFGILVTLLLLAALPFIYADWRLSPGVFFWEGLNAAAAMVAILTYFYAMSKAQASWVLGITAGYPIVGQLLSTPLTGEPFSLSAIAAASLVSLGVALIGSSATQEQKGLSRKDKLLLVGAVILSTVLWGLLGIFEKRSLEFARPFEAYFVLSLWKSLFLAVVYCLFRRQGQSLILNRAATWKFGWLSAFCVAAGNIGFILALTTSPAGYLIVMTAAYPLVMYVFALLFLKEKLNLARAAGIVLIVFGAVVAEVARGL
ncbi:MAG TPA: EamA family transporter [Candidatus Obscuribacterales bacterium]